MSTELITRTAKRYYEELFMQGGSRQLYNMLFPTVDSATVENFLLDAFIQTPYGVRYRHADMQSALRPFVNGEGKLYKIPRASEKTALSESLLEKVAVGLDSTAGFTANEAAIIGKIIKDHVAGHYMTKNKQALEVLENGIFEAHGVDGDSLDIKFERDSALNMSYDFTQAGNTFSKAVAEQQEELRDKGTPLSNLVMMCGQNWLSEYSLDEDATQASVNNSVNQLLVNPMQPQLLNGTQGVYVLGQMRTRDMLAPVWIASYSPGVKYRADIDSVGEDFLNADKALMFSMDDERYNVQRGIRVKTSAGKAKTVTGDIVIDEYTTDDPVATFLRSATRHAFVPANINHTSASTGTFV